MPEAAADEHLTALMNDDAMLYVQMLKLFLALLLSSFSGESMHRREQETESEPNRIQEALDRFRRYSYCEHIATITRISQLE